MSAFPYMRLYVGDYLGDTRHLTTLEHGAYMLLIMTYWQRGKALPNRDSELAHIAGVTRPQWLKMRDKILDFFEVFDDKISHPRIEKEIEHMLAKSLKSQRAGQASVERRRNKRSTKPQSRVHIPVEDPDKSGSDAPEGARDGDDDEPEAAPPSEHYTAPFEAFWSRYPNKTGKRAAANAYDAAFKRLGGQQAGTARVHAHLVKAIEAQAKVWARTGTEGRFIPHGATWLNQSRWNDALVVKQMAHRAAEVPAMPEPELTPPTPAPAKRPGPRLTPSGWRPDAEDDDETVS